MSISGHEQLLKFQCRALKLPEPEREVRFHATRRWRFDLAWPSLHLAAEVEGGIWKGGRHTRGKGYEGDCEKYNSAALAGWRVLRFTTGMVKDGRAINVLERALRGLDEPSLEPGQLRMAKASLKQKTGAA